MLALGCDILLFMSRVNARSSEGPNGRLAKKELQSVVDDVLSLQIFSSSFNISKIIAPSVQQSFFKFFFNGDTFVSQQCFYYQELQRGWNKCSQQARRGRVLILQLQTKTQNESAWL